jgi:hypothetical protein
VLIKASTKLWWKDLLAQHDGPRELTLLLANFEIECRDFRRIVHDLLSLTLHDTSATFGNLPIDETLFRPWSEYQPPKVLGGLRTIDRDYLRPQTHNVKT